MDGDGAFRISEDNYARIFRDCESFCRAAGKPITFAMDAVPESGLAKLYRYVSSFIDNPVLYRDVNGDVRLYQREVVADGWSGHCVPVMQTYTAMRGEFGLLVRRFIKSLFAGLGIGTDTKEMAAGTYRDWMMEMADDAEQDGDEVREFFSDDPQSPASRLREFDDIEPVTADELRSFVPETDSERDLLEYMLSGERFLGSDICLPGLAEFEGFDVIDDDDAEQADFITVDSYFGLLWSIDDDDVLTHFISGMMNDSFNSGTSPQALVLNREVGAGGPLDPGASDEVLGLEFMDGLAARIDGFKQ